jgi:hypothetical protein
MTLPKIDLQELAKLQGPAKSEFVGNHIYGLIQQAYGDEYCPRITGMLLDESAVNYYQLLSDDTYFNNKVQEAHALLMSTQNTQQ